MLKKNHEQFCFNSFIKTKKISVTATLFITLKMTPQQAFSEKISSSLQNLDPETDAITIIEIVLNHGTHEDYKLLVEKYTTEKLKGAICCIRTFDRKTRNFLSIIFDIPVDDIYDSGFVKRYDFYTNSEYIEILDEEKYYARTKRKTTDR